MKAALFTLALSLCLLAAVSAAAVGDRPSGGGDGGAGGQTGGDGGQTRGRTEGGLYDNLRKFSVAFIQALNCCFLLEPTL